MRRRWLNKENIKQQSTTPERLVNETNWRTGVHETEFAKTVAASHKLSRQPETLKRMRGEVHKVKSDM